MQNAQMKERLQVLLNCLKNINNELSFPYESRHYIDADRWLSLIIAKDVNNIALFTATRCGFVHVIQNLLANCTNVDEQKDEHGNTLLMLASCNDCSIEVVKWLILKGANVEYIGPQGINAAIVAVQNRSIEVLKYLIASGADINYVNLESSIRTSFLQLIVCRACDSDYDLCKKYLEILIYLIECGANVNYVNLQGYTSLMLAVILDNNVTVVQELLKYKDKILINVQQTDFGYTALNLARMYNKHDIALLLVADGATYVDECNNEIHLAIHITRSCMFAAYMLTAEASIDQIGRLSAQLIARDLEGKNIVDLYTFSLYINSIITDIKSVESLCENTNNVRFV